jgi:hypothetical protein
MPTFEFFFLPGRVRAMCVPFVFDFFPCVGSILLPTRTPLQLVPTGRKNRKLVALYVIWWCHISVSGSLTFLYHLLYTCECRAYAQLTGRLWHTHTDTQTHRPTCAHVRTNIVAQHAHIHIHNTNTHTTHTHTHTHTPRCNQSTLTLARMHYVSPPTAPPHTQTHLQAVTPSVHGSLRENLTMSPIYTYI